MAVTLESNRIPLEPAIPALVSPVDCAGRSSPLGATILRGGVNFSIFYRGASGIELLFFDREDDTRPASVIGFDRKANLTGHYWHVFVPGVQPSQLYGYRIHGPYDPANRLRFGSSKVLLRPIRPRRDRSRFV